MNQTPPPEGEKLHSDSGISVDSQSLHDQQPHTQTAASQGKQRGQAGAAGGGLRLGFAVGGLWGGRFGGPLCVEGWEWWEEGMRGSAPFQGNDLGNGSFAKLEHLDSSS